VAWLLEQVVERDGDWERDEDRRDRSENGVARAEQKPQCYSDRFVDELVAE
jgi:hypothetical protein